MKTKKQIKNFKGEKMKNLNPEKIERLKEVFKREFGSIYTNVVFKNLKTDAGLKVLKTSLARQIGIIYVNHIFKIAKI